MSEGVDQLGAGQAAKPSPLFAGFGGASTRQLGVRLPRDNNFDLIRLFAAAQVAVFHSAHHLHAEVPAWIAKPLGLFPGVPVFFFISGLLVTSSLSGRTLPDYAKSRGRRVFPALWLAFALALLILGAFGQLQVSGQLILWMLTQATVLQVWNPPMFRDFGVGVVNGSLWTIPVEIGFYCILPMLVWLARGSQRALTIILLTSAVASFGVHRAVTGSDVLFLKLLGVTPAAHLWLFALGALAYLHFDKVMGFARRLGCVAPLAAYLAFGLVIAPDLPGAIAEAVNTLLLVTCVFTLGLVARSRASVLRGTDISYGMYLFHMLVVNVLVELGWFGWPATWTALIIATMIAWFSWTFLESRVLRRRPTGGGPMRPLEDAP